jgi:poly-gamma-glutamate system protein
MCPRAEKISFLWSSLPYAPRLTKTLRRTLLLLAALLLVVVQSLEYVRTPRQVAEQESQLRAAERMLRGMMCIRDARLALGIGVDLAIDPNGTGLIGEEYTDLTTTQGSLRAKRTSLNPQFAGLALSLMRRAGVQKGDRVALCFSGSFPALNIAVLAACEELEVNPFIISSVGASAFGANIPGLTWLDMERILFEQGQISHRSSFVSLGGIVETEGGIDGTGIEQGMQAICKHGAIYLDEGHRGKLLADIERRETLNLAGGPPAIFVNVGGNITSLGWVAQAARLENGLLRKVPACQSPQRGIIFRMMEQGVPVIHFLNIESLAARNLLPLAPVPLPPIENMDRKAALERRTWLQVVTLGLWLLVAAWLSSTNPGANEL